MNTIMIIDDEVDQLSILSLLFTAEGYNVAVFESGEAALAAARSKPPDLVLLDVIIPQKDGYQTCKDFKRDKKLADVPIVFMSVSHDVQHKVKALEIGAVDYITKPFQNDEVVARVQSHLQVNKLQMELKAKYRELQKMEELRDSLVHMVVHDMKSPIFAILCNLELLNMEIATNLDEEQGQYLTNAIAQTKTLTTMVSSILDVSRLDQEQMHLKRDFHELTTIISKTIDELGPLARFHKIKLLGNIDKNVSCDEDIIRRVVCNLLDNAIKFSPRESTVEIHLLDIGYGCKISFCDQGQGIPAEYHNKVFEKFGQVDNKKNRKFSNGLGLAFCKLAVNMHGGEIGLESKPGEGSCFWFTLPYNLAQGVEIKNQ